MLSNEEVFVLILSMGTIFYVNLPFCSSNSPLACGSCPYGQLDYYQCVKKKSKICIDIIPVDSSKIRSEETLTRLKEGLTNRKILTRLVTSHNVFTEDHLLKHNDDLKGTLVVGSKPQNTSVVLTRKSGLELHLTVEVQNIHPVYEDVDHAGDNNFILSATPHSTFYRLRQPLLNITSNFCRFPIPEHYYITMKKYKHRATSAVRMICANPHNYPKSQYFCPPGSYDGQIYYFRTVNDRCSSNKASILPFEKSSFYCTQNTKLTTQIFGERVTEKKVTTSSALCDLYYRKCKACLRIARRKCNGLNGRTCCQLKCYQKMGCIAFFSSKCYTNKLHLSDTSDNVCIKGDTLKFSLTPQFNFDNGHFLCHLKRKHQPNQRPMIRIEAKLKLKEHDSVLWTSQIKINQEYFRGRSELETVEFDIFRVVLKNQMIVDDEVYMSEFRKGATLKTGKLTKELYQEQQEYQSRFHQIKPKNEFQKDKLQIIQHKDIKYLKIQNGQPFFFSTENWYNNSCWLQPQNLFPNQHIYRDKYWNVTLWRQSKIGTGTSLKAPFTYTVGGSSNERYRPPHAVISLTKQSIFGYFLCSKDSGKLKFLNDPVNPSFLSLSNIRWPTEWKVHFRGFVSSLPTLVSTKIVHFQTQILLFHIDQVVLTPLRHDQSYQFENTFYFTINNLTDKSQIYFKFDVELKDCFQSKTYQLYYVPKFTPSNISLTQQSRNSRRSVLQSMSVQLANKLTVLTLSLGSFYIFLIVVCIILNLWKSIATKSSNYRGNISLKDYCTNKTKNHLTYRRKCFMLFYVSFRVFYTFLFTLSVALSLVLGLDSYSGSYYQTDNSVNSQIHNEMEQVNQFLQNELYRQFSHSNNMVTVCRNQDNQKIHDLIRQLYKELNQTLIKLFYPNQAGSILNETNTQLHSSVSMYRTDILSLCAKLEFNMQNRFRDRYGQYQQLIEQYYSLNYLTTVNRVLNDSQLYQFNNLLLSTPLFSVDNKAGSGDRGRSRNRGRGGEGFRTVGATQKNSFVKKHLLKFAKMLEIYEASSLNSYPNYMGNQIKQQFESIKWFEKQWQKTNFESLPTVKIVDNANSQKQTVRRVVGKSKRRNVEYQRMMDTSLERYVLSNVALNSLRQPPLLNGMFRLADSTDRYNGRQRSNEKMISSFRLLNTRLLLMVLDCFIVVYRFYNTFQVLRSLWLGHYEFLIEKEQQQQQTVKTVITGNQTAGSIEGMKAQLQHPLPSSFRILPHSTHFPDWSEINSDPTVYVSCFKSRRYLQTFGQPHFITVVMVIVLVVFLIILVMIISANQWGNGLFRYPNYYQYSQLKQQQQQYHNRDAHMLTRLATLVNSITSVSARHINSLLLYNAKVHNINMSSLIINNSYVLHHIKNRICQESLYELTSVKQTNQQKSSGHSIFTLPLCDPGLSSNNYNGYKKNRNIRVPLSRRPFSSEYLPNFFAHVSPCHFINLIPINYSLPNHLLGLTGGIWYDHRQKSPLTKIGHLLLLATFAIVIGASSVGCIHIICRLMTRHCYYYYDSRSASAAPCLSKLVVLSPLYPNTVSVKIHTPPVTTTNYSLTNCINNNNNNNNSSSNIHIVSSDNITSFGAGSCISDIGSICLSTLPPSSAAATASKFRTSSSPHNIPTAPHRNPYFQSYTRSPETSMSHYQSSQQHNRNIYHSHPPPTDTYNNSISLTSDPPFSQLPSIIQYQLASAITSESEV